jgi:3-methylcrotonyl-CoA carboxylase beta subunit
MWPGARASASPDAPDDEAGALNWARQLWCDAIVEPERTRAVLTQLLDVAGRLPAQPAAYGAFRM